MSSGSENMNSPNRIKPLITWNYCEDGSNLPPTNKTRVCVFRRQTGAKLESCVLIEDLETERKYWVLKGSVDGKEVYPFAWLSIEEDFPVNFFVNLRQLGFLEY